MILWRMRMILQSSILSVILSNLHSVINIAFYFLQSFSFLPSMDSFHDQTIRVPKYIFTKSVNEIGMNYLIKSLKECIPISFSNLVSVLNKSLKEKDKNTVITYEEAIAISNASSCMTFMTLCFPFLSHMYITKSCSLLSLTSHSKH